MLLSNRPGYIASGSAHAALLVATLLSFSQSHKFEDAHESVPVEMVTDQQFSEILKGEKTAKEIKPTPKADKVADIAELKPDTPIAEAQKDIPIPPAPLKRQADPGEAETQDVPTPPQRSEVTPPKPTPIKPPPPAPTVAEKPPAPDAEPLIPKPPKRQDFAKEEPKKQEPQFKPDQLAKLLEQQKQKEEAQKPVEKPVAKPKSGDETEQPHKFSASDISRLLSKEAPQRMASTGSQLQHVASLGTSTGHALKMSESMSDQLNGLLLAQLKRCWSDLGLGNQKTYVPTYRINYAQDGSLIGEPSLLNPSTDPALRSVAAGALRAVHACNPLHIPAIYQPYYDEWKELTVNFTSDDS
jgi:colicin import membrane protein